MLKKLINYLRGRAEVEQQKQAAKGPTVYGFSLWKHVMPIDGKDWSKVSYVGIPSGYAVVRLRVRCNEPAELFLRGGKSFERWDCEFADESQQTIKALWPTAINCRAKS